MSLDPVALNDPHVAAHNEERTRINTLETTIEGMGSVPIAPLAKSPIPVGTSAYSGLAENFPRWACGANATAIAAGRVSASPVYLEEGAVVREIAFKTGTTGGFSAPTKQQFALYSPALALLGTTVDDGATAWAVNTTKRLAMSSPYEVPTSGWYYAGILVVGGSMPSMAGVSLQSSAQVGDAPSLHVTSALGLSAHPNPLVQSGANVAHIAHCAVLGDPA